MSSNEIDPVYMYQFQGELSRRFLISSSGGAETVIDWPDSHSDSWFELVTFSSGTPPTTFLRGARSRQFLYTSTSDDPIGHMLIGHGLQRFRIHIIGKTDDGTLRVRLQGKHTKQYVYSSSGNSHRVGSISNTHGDTVFHMIRGSHASPSIWTRIDPSGVYWFRGRESRRYILSSSGGDQALRDWPEPHGDTAFRIDVVDHDREIFRLKGVRSNKYVYSSSSSGGDVGHLSSGHDDQQFRPYLVSDESDTMLLRIRGARSKKMLYSSSNETRLGHTTSIDHADTVFEIIPYDSTGTPPGTPPGTQSEPPSSDDDGGFPTWAIISIIIGIVGLITALVMFL